ncbi:hypothetical protein C8J57DRAFT_1235445 [Mycena rebaudengoi]|nr:hypothetical protein C8J57DRAFT_1235445 [Mycena rebaudengoi]
MMLASCGSVAGAANAEGSVVLRHSGRRGGHGGEESVVLRRGGRGVGGGIRGGVAGAAGAEAEWMSEIDKIEELDQRKLPSGMSESQRLSSMPGVFYHQFLMDWGG